MVALSWFTSPLPGMAACALMLSSFTVSFYALDSCFETACPVRNMGQGTAPLALVPYALWSSTSRQEITSNLSRLFTRPVALSVFRCILRSEVASVALVLACWSMATLLLLALLATFVPHPRQPEVSAFRRSTSFFAVTSVLSSVHILAVSTRGYSDFTTILLFWSWKFLAYQLRTITPLRSDAIRRAAHVRVAALSSLLGFTTFLAILHALFTRALFIAAPALSHVVFFELCALGLHALHFATLAASEALHIADELANRAAAASATADAVPSFWNERRAEMRDVVRFVHEIVEGSALLVHHAAVLYTFGFRWRIGDVLLLYDMRHFSIRLLEALQHALRQSLAQALVRDAFATASAGPFSLHLVCILSCTDGRVAEHSDLFLRQPP
jgi:hypothetical protein